MSDRSAQTVLSERSEEHTSELQSLAYLVCRLLLEKKKKTVTESIDAQMYDIKEIAYARQAHPRENKQSATSRIISDVGDEDTTVYNIVTRAVSTVQDC